MCPAELQSQGSDRRPGDFWWPCSVCLWGGAFLWWPTRFELFTSFWSELSLRTLNKTTYMLDQCSTSIISITQQFRIFQQNWIQEWLSAEHVPLPRLKVPLIKAYLNTLDPDFRLDLRQSKHTLIIWLRNQWKCWKMPHLSLKKVLFAFSQKQTKTWP